MTPKGRYCPLESAIWQLRAAQPGQVSIDSRLNEGKLLLGSRPIEKPGSVVPEIIVDFAGADDLPVNPSRFSRVRIEANQDTLPFDGSLVDDCDPFCRDIPRPGRDAGFLRIGCAMSLAGEDADTR